MTPFPGAQIKPTRWNGANVSPAMKIDRQNDGVAIGKDTATYDISGPDDSNAALVVVNDGTNYTNTITAVFENTGAASSYITFPNTSSSGGYTPSIGGSGDSMKFITGSAGSQSAYLTSSGNLIIGSSTAAGTNAVSVLKLDNGTAPTTAKVDSVQLWSADYAAGDARLYVRGESGANVVIGNGTVEATTFTGNAATVTTNANLTGPITSSGNATSIASQTGTGTTFVVDASPTLTTPKIANVVAPSDSTTAIKLSNAAGTVAGITIDTTNNFVGVGNLTPTCNLDLNSAANSLPATSGSTQTGNVFRINSSGATTLDFGIFASSGLFWLQGTSKTDHSSNRGILINPNGGNIAIGRTGAAVDRLHINVGTTDAIECLQLQQQDVSEGFINFVSTSAANTTNPLTTWTTGQTIQGHLRIEINGTDRWIPFYDAPTS